MRLNWKKILFVSTAALFAPGVGQWWDSYFHGAPVAFTVQNILLPGVAALGPTLYALFSNPRYK